jgi:hypothetical protein
MIRNRARPKPDRFRKTCQVFFAGSRKAKPDRFSPPKGGVPKTCQILGLFLLLFLTGCGQLRQAPGIRMLFETPVAEGGPTPTPLPTSVAPAFPVVAPRACKVAELESLRTDLPQGDLMAWSPVDSTLAYLGPASNSIWYTGQIHLAQAPDFTPGDNLAPDIAAWGDLTWSPEGDALAFVAWRLPDAYTLMTVAQSGGTPVDLLPGASAVTDARDSSKAIREWRSGFIYALSACGDDCDQTLTINPDTGSFSSGEPGRSQKDRLKPSRRVETFDEDIYPAMEMPNWSPDGKQVVYFDAADRVWVLLTADRLQYILTIPITFPREAKWSSDNRWLALRSDDMIEIFDTTCAPAD